MTDREKREFILKLLVLRAIRSIQTGNAVKLEGKNKGNSKMKVTADWSQFKNAFILNNRQMQRILDVIVEDIKKRTPEDTGQLKQSIRSKIVGTNKGQIYIDGKRNNEVAKYQHFGTDSHFVAPKKAGGVLAWKSGGEWAYSKGHDVVGITATYFFEPSQWVLNKVKDMIKVYITLAKKSVNLRQAA